MRVLVVQESKVERENILKMLTPGRHVAQEACDFASAAAQLGEGFDTILLDWTLPNRGASALLSRIGEMSLNPTPHVVILFEQNPGGDIGSIFSQGARDFMRKPFWKEELVARIEAPLRLRTQRGAAIAVDLTNEPDPLLFREWHDMGALIGRDLSAMAGLDLEVLASSVEGTRSDFVASMPLSLTSRFIDIHFTAAVERASLFALGRAILGDRPLSDEIARDSLREIVNSAAGAAKRAAPECEQLTTGLPASVATSHFRGTSDRATWRFRCRVRGASTELSFAVEKVSIATRVVAADALREGMVLVDDLRNEAGLLLISRGTRLTSTTALRVARLVGEKQKIEIASAA